MPDVDGFFSFVSEELGKDHGSGLTVYAPGPDQLDWEVVGGGKGASHDTLTGALNQLSRVLDFTGKDLKVDEEPSLIKRVAEQAGETSSPLVVTYGDTGWIATVPITSTNYSCVGHELTNCLHDLLIKLLGETND